MTDISRNKPICTIELGAEHFVAIRAAENACRRELKAVAKRQLNATHASHILPARCSTFNVTPCREYFTPFLFNTRYDVLTQFRAETVLAFCIAIA